MTLTTLAYLRVSDPRQATADKVSLEAQQVALEQLAAKLGRTLDPAGVFLDPGVSGGTADRPAFQRLLAYCEANPRPKKDGVILVYRDDRWGRFEDTDEAGHYAFIVRRSGWHIRFAVMGSDDDTVEPLLRAIGRVAGREERRKIMDRSRTGMRGASEKGFWVNREPFAMRRLAVDTTTGVARQLAPGQRKGSNETLRLTLGPADEVAFVEWLFARYASGEVSVNELLVQAPARWTGAPKTWHWSTVHRILSNPVYCGDLAVGRGREILVRDAFPAIVDRGLWMDVQALLRRNAKETSPVRYAYPLSGLLTCATCGQPFVGGGSAAASRFPEGDRRRNAFYKDSGYSRSPRCPGHLMTVLCRAIEPQVVKAVGDVIAEHDLATALSKAYDRMLERATGGHASRNADLARTQTQLEAKRARLVAAVADGTLLKAEADPQLAAVRADLARVIADRERTRFDARRHARVESERDARLAIATDFPARAAALHGLALRELLRPWIASAVVDKDARTVSVAVRRVPAMSDSFTPSADQRGEADTVVRVIPLLTKSEWAKLREARKRAARAEAAREVVTPAARPRRRA